MTSLYGGKPGVSFVIKERFNYISPNDDTYQAAIAAGKTAEELAPLTMSVCFEDPSYKDVWYNEYCIIDTVNKSDTNNGKIFRRTLKEAGDSPEVGGVAEYVGQIVGPAGMPPIAEIGGLEETENTFDSIGARMTSNDFIKYYNPLGELKNEWDNSDLKVFDNNGGINFVAGNTQDEQGHYPQEIQYNWFQFVDGSTDTDTPAQVYIGFKIPYHVNDFEKGDALNYTEQPTLTQTIAEPFYNHYKINIPRGITGANVRDFQEIIADEDTVLYNFSDIIYNAEEDTYDIGSPTAASQVGKDVQAAHFYWNDTAGVEHILTDANEEPVLFYVGGFKDIRSIDITDDGTVEIEYSDTTTQTFDKKLKWINSIRLRGDAEPGDDDLDTKPDNQIHVTYSDGSTVALGDNINYIQEVYVTAPNDPRWPLTLDEPTHEGYHLLILFNNANYRDKLAAEGKPMVELLSEQGEPQGLLWFDAGYMRRIDQGLYVQNEIAVDADDEQGAAQELEAQYPNGLQGSAAGKLVAVRVNDGTVFLMAFNYDNNHWFSIGALSTAAADAIIDGYDGVEASDRALHATPIEEVPAAVVMSTPWKVVVEEESEPSDEEETGA